MRVAIFCIEVPERGRELSEEQYAVEVAYCFELNSLPLSGTEVQKMLPEESRELTTGEGFHFTFDLHDGACFTT